MCNSVACFNQRRPSHCGLLISPGKSLFAFNDQQKLKGRFHYLIPRGMLDVGLVPTCKSARKYFTEFAISTTVYYAIKLQNLYQNIFFPLRGFCDLIKTLFVNKMHIRKAVSETACLFHYGSIHWSSLSTYLNCFLSSFCILSCILFCILSFIILVVVVIVFFWWLLRITCFVVLIKKSNTCHAYFTLLNLKRLKHVYIAVLFYHVVVG